MPFGSRWGRQEGARPTCSLQSRLRGCRASAGARTRPSPPLHTGQVESEMVFGVQTSSGFILGGRILRARPELRDLAAAVGPFELMLHL